MRLSTHLTSLPFSFISQLPLVSSTSSFRSNSSLFSRHFTAPSAAAAAAAAAAENVVSSKKKVDHVMPIAPCLSRQELEDLLDESPALIKSYYDKRIIGCPGPDGEGEHDIAWFWLEKGKPHECPLEVVGPGGSPDGHSDNDQH